MAFAFRKLKLHLEGQIHKRIELSHRMVPWMVSWAAEVILKFEVQANGRTRYEDLTGHRVRQKILGFGEHAHFKPATDDGHRSNFDGEWLNGFFAGVIAWSSEYLVIKGETAYKCPTMMSRAENEQYTENVLQEMQADYYKYIKSGARSTPQREVVHEALQAPHPDPEAREYAPRRLLLRREDFVRHGFTAGYYECARLCTGVGNRRAHNAECRS